jgi:hypothetical protein
MSILAPSPFLQFLDNNGNPLAGGSLYTYAGGTQTPIATFTDYTGTINNPNPIILDAGGRAELWINPALSYKFIVQSADGTFVKTTDNIGTVVSANGSPVDTIPLLKALGTPSGYDQILVGGAAVLGDGGGGLFYWNSTSIDNDDGAITILPTGQLVGTPGRWKRVIEDGMVDPRWFGADITGAVDASSDLHNASLAAVSLSMPLKFVAGTYTVLSTSSALITAECVFFPFSKINYTGASAGSLKIVASPFDNVAITDYSATPQIHFPGQKPTVISGYYYSINGLVNQETLRAEHAENLLDAETINLQNQINDIGNGNWNPTDSSQPTSDTLILATSGTDRFVLSSPGHAISSLTNQMVRYTKIGKTIILRVYFTCNQTGGALLITATGNYSTLFLPKYTTIYGDKALGTVFIDDGGGGTYNAICQLVIDNSDPDKGTISILNAGGSVPTICSISFTIVYESQN